MEDDKVIDYTTKALTRMAKEAKEVGQGTEEEEEGQVTLESGNKADPFNPTILKGSDLFNKKPER